MRHFNILVFPGGSEIGLEIQKSLSHCKDISLFSVGLDTPNHAPFVFRHHFNIPSIREPGWIDRLNEIIDDHDIDYIYPAYDDVLLALIQNTDLLRAECIASPLVTCEITRSKRKTYEHLKGIIPIPDLYTLPIADPAFPLFIKPDIGQGSQGALRINTSDELKSALRNDPTGVIMAYLPGEEVTVDCFSDRDRGLLFAQGRRRTRMKSGIAMANQPIVDEQFRAIAAKIASRLEMHGAWFFQLKRDANGEFKLLEVAPRIAGTMALHRVMGINFPLLSIYEKARIPFSIMLNPGHVAIERALVNRYATDYAYQSVYVDLDDTLILRDRVNLMLIRFLYQCVNEQIPIRLITRHRGNLAETLRKYRLEGLFDQIIHLGEHESKSDFILEPDAIFIDDSFSERAEVHRARGIRTFDCSMIELFLNERA